MRYKKVYNKRKYEDGAILPARDYPLYPASKITPKAI